MDHPIVRYTGDTMSISAIVMALLGFLPAIAAVIGILYYLIQIWESATVRQCVKRLQERRLTRRLKKMVARRRILREELAALEQALPPTPPPPTLTSTPKS